MYCTYIGTINEEIQSYYIFNAFGFYKQNIISLNYKSMYKIANKYYKAIVFCYIIRIINNINNLLCRYIIWFLTRYTNHYM